MEGFTASQGWLALENALAENETVPEFAAIVTTSLTGLSDFVANLEGSTWFKKPVDIVDSQVISDPKTGDIFKFSVKAVFNNPEAPPPPPAPTPGARGRGAAGAKK